MTEILLIVSGKFFTIFIKPVESLQSHIILTMSHWSSGLPVCFPSRETRVQNPWGDLCETGILLLALSRYKPIKNLFEDLKLARSSGIGGS